MGQVGESSESMEDFNSLKLNTVGSREPWKALGQRSDSWTLRKQSLFLMEHYRCP